MPRPKATEHAPTRDRDAAWTLRHLDGDPIEAIAAEADSDPRTVQAGIARGLARLRRAMSRLISDGFSQPSPR